MNLLKTIRLDPSDTFVFPVAAEPGEWAVPGGFVFWRRNVEQLEGKERTSFRAGFLGLASLGRSTLVQVVSATDADRAGAVEQLARQLCDRFGAPNIETARVAAGEEVAFASSLANHPTDTLIAVRRSVEDGEIREQFRTLRRREGMSIPRVFDFAEVDDEEPEERVDLTALANSSAKDSA